MVLHRRDGDGKRTSNLFVPEPAIDQVHDLPLARSKPRGRNAVVIQRGRSGDVAEQHRGDPGWTRKIATDQISHAAREVFDGRIVSHVAGDARLRASEHVVLVFLDSDHDHCATR